MNGLGVALKEWAVICRALAEGRQTLLLRKGGIAEKAFSGGHRRFWLYPTYVHQQEARVVPAALPLLERALAERPPEGVVRLSHFAEVQTELTLTDLGKVLRLAPLHLLSEQEVRIRFAYRQPQLFAMVVRVSRVAAPVDLAESPTYAGCKSWVELGRDLPTDGAKPVLDDTEFSRFAEVIVREAFGRA
jgi:hypothetical protein